MKMLTLYSNIQIWHVWPSVAPTNRIQGCSSFTLPCPAIVWLVLLNSHCSVSLRSSNVRVEGRIGACESPNSLQHLGKSHVPSLSFSETYMHVVNDYCKNSTAFFCSDLKAFKMRLWLYFYCAFVPLEWSHLIIRVEVYNGLGPFLSFPNLLLALLL
jgi:hypothetical protein